MSEYVRFPLDFDSSAAYQSVDKLANYAQSRFQKIQIVGNSGNSGFSELNTQATKFNRTLSFTTDRMVAFAATGTIIFGLGRAFKSLYNNAILTEKALADIQVNVKLTTAEMSSLTTELFKAANQTGQSFYAAAEAAAEFARQGLRGAEIARATASALTLSQISGMEAADSVKALTSAINTFGKSAISYEEYVNRVAAADTSFAVSSKDIAEAISRVGSTAKDAGVEFNSLAALVTSLQQTTARGGAVIGNSMKTIFTRLQRSDVSSALANIGINNKDSEGNFIDQIEVLKTLAGAYDKLSDSQQSAISEKIGGVYQINAVKGILQDLKSEFSVFEQARGVISSATDEAFVKSEFLSRTAANRINEAKNSFVGLSEVIGRLGVNSSTADIAQQIADVVSSATKSLGENSESASIGEKFGQAFVSGIVEAISGPGLATLAVAVVRLSKSVLSSFKSDIQSVLGGGDTSAIEKRASFAIEENRQKILAIQNEKELNLLIEKGNASLSKRAAINSVSATSYGAVPYPRSAPQRPRSLANGFIPAIQRESIDISNGVGGAGKNAKPVIKKLNTKSGSQKSVVVNSDEIIVRNYMGSGADAVFNKKMVRNFGGYSAVAQVGSIENLSRGQIPNFAKGYTSGMGSDKLISILNSRSSTESQKELALAALKRMGILDDPSSTGAGLKKKYLTDKAIISAYNQGVKNENVDRNIYGEASSRGIFSNPDSIKAGLKTQDLSNDALSTIAKSKGNKYKGFVLKARAERKRRAEELRSERSSFRSKRDAPRKQIESTIASQKNEGRNRQRSLNDELAERKKREQVAYMEKIQKEEERRIYNSFESRQSRYLDAVSPGNEKTGAGFLAGRSAGLVKQQDYSEYVNTELRKDKGRRENALQEKINKEKAASMFASSLSDSKFTSKKDINSLARRIEAETGTKIDKSDIREATRQARIGKSQNFALKAGITASAATLGASAIGDLTGNQGLGNFVGSVSTGVALGSAGGPVGAGVGALVGAISGTAVAIKKAGIPFEKIEKEINSLGIEVEKNRNSLTSFFEAEQSLKTAIQNPDSRPETVRRAAKAQAAALSDLPSEIRQKLLSEDNEKNRVTIANEYTADQQRVLNIQTALGSLVANADKNNDSLSFFARGLFNSNGGFATNVDQSSADKSINTLIGNLDIDKLREISSGGGENRNDARNALEFLDDGNFKSFFASLKDLGVVSEEVYSKIKTVVDDIRPDVLNSSLRAANANLEESAKNAQILAEKMKSAASAVEDFSTFQNSIKRRNSSQRTSEGISQSLYNARLGFVSDRATGSDSIKSVISFMQSISESDSQKNQARRAASESVIEVVGKALEEKGKPEVSKQLGEDFISQVIDGKFDPEKVEESLGKIISASSKSTSVFFSQNENLLKIAESLQEAQSKAELEKTIQIEQLKNLQDINKKQKFDKLIESLSSFNPVNAAFDSVDILDSAREYFDPKNLKEFSKEFANARRGRNSNSLLDLTVSRGEEARRILSSDSESVKSGQSSRLNKFQKASLQSDALRAQTLENFVTEADLSIGRIGNQLGADRAKPAIENAKFAAGGGLGDIPGSFEAMERAARIISAAMSSIPGLDTKKPFGVLSDLKTSMGLNERSRASSSGVYSEEIFNLSKISKGGGSPSDMGAVLDAITLLENGNSSGAIGKLSSISKPEESLSKVISDIQSKSTAVEKTKATRESLLAKASRDNGEISPDFKEVFVENTSAKINESSLLNSTLTRLDETINRLSIAIQTEGRIANISADNVGLQSEKASLETRKNQLIKDPQILTAEERKATRNAIRDNGLKNFLLSDGTEAANSRKKTLLGVLETGNLNPEKAKFEKSRGGNFGDYKPTNEDAQNIRGALEDLKFLNQNNKPITSELENFEKNILKAFEKIYGLSGKPSDDSELKSVIEQLKLISEKMNANTEKADAIRKEGEVNTKSTAQLNVNVSGLSGELSGLASALEQKIKEWMSDQNNLKDSFPNLYKSGLAQGGSILA